MTSSHIIVTAASKDVARPYCAALERRGARTQVATPRTFRRLPSVWEKARGLLLTGGPDVDPTLYHGPSDAAAPLELNRALDRLELLLLRQALERDLPVLAICRGMQLLNVAFGGSLIQDLPGHRASRDDGEEPVVRHSIYLAPGAKLAAILGTGGFFRVNSIHHQGLREPQKAPTLLASCYNLSDGLIEGLESPQHDWVVGVQCHPERESEVPRVFGNLFQAFVERSGGE